MSEYPLKVGQILWFIMRFNNNGDIADKQHPYLIIANDTGSGYIEVAQVDSVKENQLYKAYSKTNHVIYANNPPEIVISKNSYIQLDNTFRIETFPELCNYRSTDAILSTQKLKLCIKKYKLFHENNQIDENKIVYLTKEEFLSLNSNAGTFH